jgi:hypothetical protein
MPDRVVAAREARIGRTINRTIAHLMIAVERRGIVDPELSSIRLAVQAGVTRTYRYLRTPLLALERTVDDEDLGPLNAIYCDLLLECTREIVEAHRYRESQTARKRRVG